MITYQDMLYQVQQATDASEGEYDNDAIVRHLIDSHGLVNVDAIDHDAFWSVVLLHDITARA
jgi:hypothetical protein